jgi:hypothetical protein
MSLLKELLYRVCGEHTTEKPVSMDERMEQKAALGGKVGYID